MHSGEIDASRLTAFAAQNSNVEEFQIAEFLNIDGSKIKLGDYSLTNSVQDNGLSIQNEKFDHLLDLDGKVINASNGDIYVPVSYMKSHTTKIGDKAIISGKEFNIAGFLRDSTMNSSLASSKRFLVSRNDFYELRMFGNLEYLVEFRLKDISALATFETAYASEKLEMNGPTVTYSLFKMMNAISDGIMIAVILLISFLVVLIAFLCIRLTLLAKIEDDYREIGVMKALGLRISDIKKLYVAKYTAIATAGSILGFSLSFVLKDPLLQNITLFMGRSDQAPLAYIFGSISVLFVFLAIITYVNIVLKRFDQISAAEAIRFGISPDKNMRFKRLTLSGNRLLNTNIFIGINDVLLRKKLYATILAVLVIATFIMVVPQNLYHTISSKSFINYMGIGNYDLHLQFSGNIKNIGEIEGIVKSDPAISKVSVLTTKTFKTIMTDGVVENIKVELGNHSIFPILYSEGIAPVFPDQIALSTINANEMNKRVGDVITLVIDGIEKPLTVSGIYSDITNGGKTAKAVFSNNTGEVMWSVVSAELSDKSLVETKVAEYANKFPEVKVSDIDEFVAQTFGSTISSVRVASNVATAAALLITVLITLLFMKMLIIKDRHMIAVMKAFGFTTSDIRVQYISRTLFVLTLGIIIGIVTANTVGERVSGLLISLFGASTFKFVINPLSAYLFSPLFMISAVLIATILGISSVGQIKIYDNIKE